MPLPAALRRLTPERLRDDVRLRALAVGSGLIPPRAMHSRDDARLLEQAVEGARRVVEIGVYEGASAILLVNALGAGSELHLIDPFGAHPDALPAGWGARERATRRTVERARRRAGEAPRLCWHITTSQRAAARWEGELDAVFIDGDHSYEGCLRDWLDWHPFVRVGGAVVLHDARRGREGGRGLPGPTAVVEERVRGGAAPGWEIAAEADRTVLARRRQ
jgi:predicted O-methyltransferase YrrM